MKNLIITLGGVAALLLASPAMAQPYGSVGANYTHGQFDPGSVDANGWAVDGSAGFELTPSFGAAVNAGVGDNDLPGSDSAWEAGGQVFYKTQNALLGGSLGYIDTSGPSSWSYGAVGQLNFVGFTAAAAVTKLNVDNGATGFDDAWGIDGQAKIFATDNLRLSGNVGYGDYNGVTSAFDNSEWTFGVGAEWQLASLPLSVSGDYAHVDFDKGNASSDVFKIGARWNFGGGTLRDRNDSGADLHTISTLGRF
jgi:hypothetical protein